MPFVFITSGLEHILPHPIAEFRGSTSSDISIASETEGTQKEPDRFKAFAGGLPASAWRHPPCSRDNQAVATVATDDDDVGALRAPGDVRYEWFAHCLHCLRGRFLDEFEAAIVTVKQSGPISPTATILCRF